MRLLLSQTWVDIRTTTTRNHSYFKGLMQWILLELTDSHRIRVACEYVRRGRDCTRQLLVLALCFQRDPVLLHQLFQRYVISYLSLSTSHLCLELA